MVKKIAISHFFYLKKQNNIYLIFEKYFYFTIKCKQSSKSKPKNTFKTNFQKNKNKKNEQLSKIKTQP